MIFSAEDLQLMLEKHVQARPKAKAEILLEVVAEFPDATVAELATAAERSPSWVRKHLRAAGVTLTKPARREEVTHD